MLRHYLQQSLARQLQQVVLEKRVWYLDRRVIEFLAKLSRSDTAEKFLQKPLFGVYEQSELNGSRL